MIKTPPNTHNCLSLSQRENERQNPKISSNLSTTGGLKPHKNISMLYWGPLSIFSLIKSKRQGWDWDWNWNSLFKRLVRSFSNPFGRWSDNWQNRYVAMTSHLHSSYTWYIKYFKGQEASSSYPLPPHKHYT